MRSLRQSLGRLVLLFSVVSSARGIAADDGLAQIKKAGKLLVAVDTTYPPMEMEGDNGKPAGFDIDLAKELAKRLGVSVEFVVMPWDGIIAGLAAKRYDIICSAMNITPERAKQVEFVPYLKMSQVYVAKKAGAAVVKEQDLVGKVIGVQADTTSSEYVEKVKKSGVAIKEIKAFKGATDVFAALRAGQADALVVDEPVARHYVKRDPAFFRITGRALAPEPIGIATRKDEHKLQKELLHQIEMMRIDGTLTKLQLAYFGAELGT
ncbi:MAG: ABC transporter substrate-binding protein [Proteobacteria bacterium]|nr:ABC transporter substrate-binding protein [Pseudomonadota bacterium]